MLARTPKKKSIFNWQQFRRCKLWLEDSRRGLSLFAPEWMRAPAGYSAPVAVYSHGTNDFNGCSITGGYVYRGPDILQNMQGMYFYGDFCKGKIYGLKYDAGWQTTLFTYRTVFDLGFWRR